MTQNIGEPRAWSVSGYDIKDYPYDGSVVLLEARHVGSMSPETFITTGFSENPEFWMAVELEWQADQPSRVFLDPVKWYPLPTSLSAPSLRLVK